MVLPGFLGVDLLEPFDDAFSETGSIKPFNGCCRFVDPAPM